MDNIIVIGGGGHAKVLISTLKKNVFTIMGYTDNHDRGLLLGIPFLGDDRIFPDLIDKQKHFHAIVGVGKIDASQFRLNLQNRFESLGINFPLIISPNAVVNEEIVIGQGTVVFDGAVINSGTEIGRACILNTNCTIEHDCQIGDNVHIAPGATLSGGVIVGRNTLIGTGATVIQHLSICEKCLVGAGSTVVRDITIPGRYVGSPAKRIN
jgi:sugar O-acyltransferase (sialic acid O-acetyltransferase NeuD family)